MNFQELNVAELESLLRRFNAGFDGLIERIEIEYEDGARWPTVKISVQTKDEQSVDGWAKLMLYLSDVTHLKVTEGKATYRFLSDGLVLRVLEGKWVVGVDQEQDEAETIEAFARFPFGFVASKVEWAVCH